MTVIILAVIIVLLASISGWNYYQTNKKISSLLINNSTLQSNYRVEISTLEGITKQAQTELLEQRKLISEIQSKIGSIEDIDRQDRDYWLILQIEYFLNLADSELFLGRNNQRANDLIKQARISALGLSKKNESFLLEMDSLIESIDLFIKKNKERPFFLMLSPFAVHIPLGSKSELVEKYRKRGKEKNRSLPHPIYAGLVEEVDDQVGRIVREVEAQGLTEKTMIVFTSDNGGLIKRYDYNEQSDNIVSDLAPLKGEKGSLHEGGIRVPLIVKYPKMVKAGSICSEPTISYDFYPTFVAAASATLPENQTIDGLNILPLLQNPKAKLNRKAIHWHYPHYHHDRPAGAIRERDWKLIEYLDGTGDIELYHISQDLSESKNLAGERKGKVADLKKKLSGWRNEVLARIPVPNPSYDPERAPEWWNRRSGKPIDSSARKRFPATEKDL